MKIEKNTQETAGEDEERFDFDKTLLQPVGKKLTVDEFLIEFDKGIEKAYARLAAIDQDARFSVDYYKKKKEEAEKKSKNEDGKKNVSNEK